MKRMKNFLFLIVAGAMLLSLCACENGTQTSNPTKPTESQTYTIQYADDEGIHTLGVTQGELYSISSVPQKTGYEFLGLYDAEVGGTQYVNSDGGSVAAFTDNQNIVLYPQFRAKEYTLVLDYQGAAVTGSRSMKVNYGAEINELPLNLTLENKNFTGWYTQPDKRGTQIADRYGILPKNSKITERTFDLSDPDGFITLYAGFKGEEFTVTFYFTESGAPEEVKVEYGTPISEVQLETRVDGKAVIAWSKKKNDTAKEEVFNGKVTSELVLYAAEYAPVIDFESNGGDAINSIIARAGDAIKLPTPVRENYKFIGWQDTDGRTFNAATMPENSIKLNAKWQAIIVFDTNGGTDVTNISEPQGTKIELPETEKAGYMFAGWFDRNGEKYTATAMPSVSLKLYAKYWKVEKLTKVLISDPSVAGSSATAPNMDVARYDVDLSDIYDRGVRIIMITVHYQSQHDSSTSRVYNTYMSWYSSKVASDAYKVWSYGEEHNDPNFESYVRSTRIFLNSSILYCCLHSSYYSYSLNPTWKNFYIEIEYPDTSTLY